MELLSNMSIVFTRSIFISIQSVTEISKKLGEFKKNFPGMWESGSGTQPPGQQSVERLIQITKTVLKKKLSQEKKYYWMG